MSAPLVVGFDGSDGSVAALNAAMGLAARLGAELVLVFGTSPPGVVGEEAAEHRRAIEEMAAGTLDEAVARARASGVQARVELRRERPVDALLSVAADAGAGMIVCGSYGETPLRGAILGSTPHKLLHLADRPVLVVPVTGPGD